MQFSTDNVLCRLSMIESLVPIGCIMECMGTISTKGGIIIRTLGLPLVKEGLAVMNNFEHGEYAIQTCEFGCNAVREVEIYSLQLGCTQVCHNSLEVGWCEGQ